jgi:hypothetical protein
MTPVPIQCSFLVCTVWAGNSAPEDRPPCRGDQSLKCLATIQVPERSESPNVAGTRLNGLSKSSVETNCADDVDKDVICVRRDARSTVRAGPTLRAALKTRELASTRRLTTQALWNWPRRVMFRSRYHRWVTKAPQFLAVSFLQYRLSLVASQPVSGKGIPTASHP